MIGLEKFGITLESYLDNETDIICVFGCLLTKEGQKIKREMLKWIVPQYDCIVVNQQPPGKLYEFPGLKMAKTASIRFNKSVLYLHTKGAAHSTNIYNQEKCRMVWKNEFIDNYDSYINELNHTKGPEVLCPFSGVGANYKPTILNGFIANVDAWKLADIPEPIERYRYEHIFANTDVKMYARIYNDVNELNMSDPGFRRMVTYINTFGG